MKCYLVRPSTGEVFSFFLFIQRSIFVSNEYHGKPKKTQEKKNKKMKKFANLMPNQITRKIFLKTVVIIDFLQFYQNILQRINQLILLQQFRFPFIQNFSMSESRNKLDLNNLLAKYQSGSLERSYSANYLNPSRVLQSQPVKQSRYISVANNYHQNYNVLTPISIPENFQMSKSECQQFLLKIRDELKKQSKGLKYCSENAMKQVHQNFQKQHQMIKRQILSLLEKAFQENERLIRDQLRRQGQVEPQQFIQVHRKIAAFDDGIQRLMHNLKTQDYRKAIAQVVLKDFNSQLCQLRQTVKLAKDDYFSNLGGTQINRTKIECIKNDLGSLFTINKKNSNLILNVFNDVLKDKKQSPTNQPNQSRVNTYKFSDNVSDKENPIEQQQKKSFFNFLM